MNVVMAYPLQCMGLYCRPLQGKVFPKEKPLYRIGNTLNYNCFKNFSEGLLYSKAMYLISQICQKVKSKFSVNKWSFPNFFLPMMLSKSFRLKKIIIFILDYKIIRLLDDKIIIYTFPKGNDFQMCN